MDLIRSIIENTRTNRTYLYRYKIERLGSRYEDYLQLWRGITKTEYPDPLDTGCLQVCCQLSDRDLCAGMGRTGKDSGNEEAF